MTNLADDGLGDDLGGATLTQDHSRDVGAGVGGWFGVEADDMGEVVRLELKDGWLDVETAPGPVNFELRNFPNLVTLHLWGLRGPIPEEISLLLHLEEVALVVENVTGEIPPQLQELTLLKILSLRGYKVEGGIPAWLGRLERLEQLSVEGGRLIGKVPRELFRLRHLTVLSLRWNALEGREKEIHTTVPHLGEIPSEIGELDQLRVLNLAHNKFEGVIPAELGKLSHLQEVHLSFNCLGGVIPKELGDLSNLTVLALDNNELEGTIPKEIGELRNLLALDVHNNGLRGDLPMELQGLAKLGILNLWRCHVGGNILSWLFKLEYLEQVVLNDTGLVGCIPQELFGLGNLTILSLQSNSLEGEIPPEVEKLEKLVVLNLANNRLGGTIPRQLCGLVGLSKLDLRGNQLEGSIPRELHRLRNLEELLVFDNKLEGLWDHTLDIVNEGGPPQEETGVPPQQMTELIDWLLALPTLKLMPNPFREPPEAVVEGGMEAVRRYFTDLFAEPVTIVRRDVKAVILGKGGSGKTSLRQSIRDHEPSPTSGEAESTVYVDVDRMDIGGTSISLYDFAGQAAYHGLLQMFLTRRALFLVVCDAKEFGLRSNRLTDEQQARKDLGKLEEMGVCEWLKCLAWRVPGCDVILVGTKCDLLPKDKVKDIATRIERGCRMWLERDAPSRINIEAGVSMTSCKRRPGEGRGRVRRSGPLPSLEDCMGGFGGTFCRGKREKDRSWPCDIVYDSSGDAPRTSLLTRITKTPGSKANRGSSMLIPRGWDIALTVIEALSAGRNPLHCVRRRLGLLRKLGWSGEGDQPAPNGKRRGMITGDLRETWFGVVDKLRASDGIEVYNPYNALDGALRIREHGGHLLRTRSFVFLEPTFLAAALKPVLHHNVKVTRSGAISLGMIGDRWVEFSEQELVDSWRSLEAGGILEPRLARAVWPGGLSECLLETLSSLDLTFALPRDEEDRQVVPLRLPTTCPSSVEQELLEFKREHEPISTASWRMPMGAPPGAIEKAFSKCCSVGDIQAFWRFGVLMKGALGGHDVDSRFWILLEYAQDEAELEVKVYAENTLAVAPWAALAYAMSAVLGVMWSFPGWRWTASLVLAAQAEHAIPVSETARDPGDRLLVAAGRSASNSGGADLRAFVVDLLVLLDVREPRGAVFMEVDDRFSVLRGRHTALYREKADRRRGYRKALLSASQDLRDALESMDQDRRDDPAVVTTRMADDTGEDRGERRRESLTSKADSILRELRDSGTTEELRGARDQLNGASEAMLNPRANPEVSMTFTTTMLRAMRAGDDDAPGLACMLCPWPFEHREGISLREGNPRTWSARLKADIAGKHRAWSTGDVRLFPVCAESYRLVPCGPRGQGYDLREARDWWNRTAGGMKIMVDVTCSALVEASAATTEMQVSSASEDPTGDESGAGGARRRLPERNMSRIRARLRGLVQSHGQAPVEREQDAPSQDPLVAKERRERAQAALREFIHDVEDAARAERVLALREAREHGMPPGSLPSFIFFDDVMEKIQSGDGDASARWVLKGWASS